VVVILNRLYDNRLVSRCIGICFGMIVRFFMVMCSVSRGLSGVLLFL